MLLLVSASLGNVLKCTRQSTLDTVPLLGKIENEMVPVIYALMTLEWF